MKKSAYFFVALFVLSACGNPIDENFRDEPVEEKLSGVLLEQTSTDPESGSHFLEKEDGAKVPLRSLVINLSRSNYLGNKVEIVGLFDKEKVFQVNGISVLGVVDGGTVESVKMTLYRNELLGFQIRHYSDWDVIADNDGVIFYSKNSGEGADVDRVMVSRQSVKYDTELTPEEAANPLLAFYNHGETVEGGLSSFEGRLNKIGIDKVDALKVEIKDALDFIGYYVARPGGYVYYISYTHASKDSQTGNYNIFQEMLNEFRLIPIDEEAGSTDSPAVESNVKLATFESLPYSFKASYPAAWFYAGSRSSKEGVKHHYAFSDQEVTEENELLSLDVISGAIPRGLKFTAGEREFVETSSGDKYTIYTTVEGQNYRLSGDSAYKDLLLAMAQSIAHIEREEE